MHDTWGLGTGRGRARRSGGGSGGGGGAQLPEPTAALSGAAAAVALPTSTLGCVRGPVQRATAAWVTRGRLEQLDRAIAAGPGVGTGDLRGLGGAGKSLEALQPMGFTCALLGGLPTRPSGGSRRHRSVDRDRRSRLPQQLEKPAPGCRRPPNPPNPPAASLGTAHIERRICQ